MVRSSKRNRHIMRESCENLYVQIKNTDLFNDIVIPSIMEIAERYTNTGSGNTIDDLKNFNYACHAYLNSTLKGHSLYSDVYSYLQDNANSLRTLRGLIDVKTLCEEICANIEDYLEEDFTFNQARFDAMVKHMK